MAYFTLTEARAFANFKLADAGKYPDADITAAREEIEAQIEEVADRPFDIRTKTAVLSGDGTSVLVLPDMRPVTVTAITATDSAGVSTVYSVADLLDIYRDQIGTLRRKTLGVFTEGYGNISVTYTYGEATPKPIKRAALILLVDRLVDSDVGKRAISRTDEMGTETYAVPSQRRPFGIPEVDEIIREWSDHRIGIA